MSFRCSIEVWHFSLETLCTFLRISFCLRDNYEKHCAESGRGDAYRRTIQIQFECLLIKVKSKESVASNELVEVSIRRCCVKHTVLNVECNVH